MLRCVSLSCPNDGALHGVGRVEWKERWKGDWFGRAFDNMEMEEDEAKV